MSSFRKVLYIGMTNDLIRRVYEHKESLIDGFSKKYKTCKLVYYESTNSVEAVINREKELKGWRREKKLKLIEFKNPGWKDLYDEICK